MLLIDDWTFERDGGLYGCYKKGGWTILASGVFIIIDPNGRRRSQTFITLGKAKEYCNRRINNEV